MRTPTRAATTRARLALRPLLLVASLAASLLVAEIVARRIARAVPTSVVPIYRPSSVPGAQYTLIPLLDTHALGADLRTNSLGFRGSEWARDKRAGTLRIALIGDSHAFGFGVDFAATVGEVMATLLRERLGRPVEVLNFAVNGYNARQQLAVLRSFALDFRPDLVVLVPCNNDDEPGPYASRNGYLVPRAHELGVPPEVRGVLLGSALIALGRRVVAQLAARDAAIEPPAARAPATGGAGATVTDAVPEPPLDALERAVGDPLRTMIAASRAAGARVLLATIAGLTDWRRLFQQIARDEQVPLVELLELFPEVRDWNELVARFGLSWNDHLGPEAHRRWAVAITELVAQDSAGEP
jgi:hypothetical protein